MRKRIEALTESEKQHVESMRNNVFEWIPERNHLELFHYSAELMKVVFQHLENSLTFSALLNNRKRGDFFDEKIRRKMKR